MMDQYNRMAEGAEALAAPEVEKLLRAAVAEEIERMAPDLIAKLDAARAEDSQRAAVVGLAGGPSPRVDYLRQRALELACGGYEGGTDVRIPDILERAARYHAFMVGEDSEAIDLASDGLGQEGAASASLQAEAAGLPSTEAETFGQTPDQWPAEGVGTSEPDANSGLGDGFTDRGPV